MLSQPGFLRLVIRFACERAMGRVGLEHPRLTPPKTPILQTPRAESGALDSRKSSPDPDLARVVEAWPELPEHIRAAIKALVDSVKELHRAEGDGRDPEGVTR